MAPARPRNQPSRTCIRTRKRKQLENGIDRRHFPKAGADCSKQSAPAPLSRASCFEPVQKRRFSAGGVEEPPNRGALGHMTVVQFNRPFR